MCSGGWVELGTRAGGLFGSGSPQPFEHVPPVERAGRNEIRKQQQGVESKAEPETQVCGFGQRSSSEKTKRQKSRHGEPAECHLPQLVGLSVGVCDERDPVPPPAQGNDIPTHRPRCPGVTVLVKKSGTRTDANRPGQEQPNPERRITAPHPAPLPTRSAQPSPRTIPVYPA